MARNKDSIFNKKKHIPYNYIWTKENPISYITEAYQKFIANFEYINVDGKYKIIQVTSSVSSEGKSTFLSNVSYLMALKGKKVILIDLDLRKPKVHQIYNTDNTKGLTDVLTGRCKLDEAIKKDPKYGFHVLTSGEKPTTVTSVLESQKLKDLLDTLEKEYDVLLVDSPPVMNVSDPLFISKITDAVIFIISQSETKRGVIKESYGLLKQNNVKVLGAVVTQVDSKKSRYGYSYGYGYGYGYDYNYDENND